MAIAGEDLEAEREAVARDDQADADLLAIAAMIARVASLGERIALGHSLEIRTRNIVEQKIVVEIEERTEPLLQMCFELGLVGQQMVERPVAAVVVDLLLGHAEQVVERGAAKPILGDVQLARRRTEPSDHEDRGHGRPGNVFATGRQQPREQRVEADGLPEPLRQPDVAELAAAFDAEPAQIERNRLGRQAVVEQAGLAFDADDSFGQSAGRESPFGIEFAELGDGLLANLAPVPDRAHEPPVGMRLSAFGDGGVSQIHGGASLPWPPSCRSRAMKRKEVGWHYIAKSEEAALAINDLRRETGRKMGEFSSSCGSWARYVRASGLCPSPTPGFAGGRGPG